jgi:MYXO-CTERM domain-containing protein
MAKLSLAVVLVAFLAAPGLAVTIANIEYQGAGGNLGTAGNWYVLSNINNPASRTGVTRLPTIGDVASVRNGTTTTLSSTINALRFMVGGPYITGQAAGSPTTVYINSGATMSLPSGLYDGEEGPVAEDAILAVGGTYGGTVNLAGGTVVMTTRSSAIVSVGGPNGGTLNVTGGSMYVGHGALTAGLPQIAVGAGVGNRGVVNQSGGTVKLVGFNGPDRHVMVGQGGGYGEYNLSGGLLTNNAAIDVGTEGTAAAPTRGLFVQTGGSHYCAYRVIVGWMEGQGHYKLLGGTLEMQIDRPGGGSTAELLIGRDAQTSVGGRGKVTVTQEAFMNLSFIALGGWGGQGSVSGSQIELKLGSASDFQMNTNTAYLFGKLEVSPTNGLTPTVGQEWKFLHLRPGGGLANSFSEISPGFSLDARIQPDTSTDIYLVCTGVRHPGDANNDGSVNVGDLGILAANWQQTDMFGKEWSTGDFTGDDLVNVGDLGVLAANWGWTGSPAGDPAPEPASLTLLLLGGLAMLRRRR